MPGGSVGVAAASVIPANSGRKTITFNNRSTAGQTIYLDMTAPNGMDTNNAGFVIAPGAAIAFMLEFDGPDIQQEWSAVSDVAGALLYVRETSKGV